MNDLTLTQKYYVCLLDCDGNFPKELKTNAILIISCMVELFLKEIITLLEKNTIKINKDLPEEFSYSKSLYDYINKKGTIKLTSLFAYLTITLGKYKKTIKPLIIDSLPNEVDIDKIINEIRVAILENDDIHQNTAILCMLLYHSNTINDFFSQDEREILNKKIEEIKQRPEYKEFQKISDLLSIK